jgi:hypothetical protein
LVLVEVGSVAEIEQGPIAGGLHEQGSEKAFQSFETGSAFDACLAQNPIEALERALVAGEDQGLLVREIVVERGVAQIERRAISVMVARA